MDARQHLYGVWVPRRGWLKMEQTGGGRLMFADVDIAVAQTAATLIGAGAVVLPMDRDALPAMEGMFLQAETERLQREEEERKRREEEARRIAQSKVSARLRERLRRVLNWRHWPWAG